MDRVEDVKDEVLERLMKKYKTGKYAVKEAKVEDKSEDKSEATEDTPNNKPYLDCNGDLVIPYDCEDKYKWWQSGQSVSKTLEELKAEDLIN